MNYTLQSVEHLTSDEKQHKRQKTSKMDKKTRKNEYFRFRFQKCATLTFDKKLF